MNFPTVNNIRPPQYIAYHSRRVVHVANLPHWEKGGVTYFVTFRLADSIPSCKLREWESARRSGTSTYSVPLCGLDRDECDCLFSTKIDAWLDAAWGSCRLRDDDARKIVESALRNFDGVRYTLYSFVVMPNHVHVLFMPWEGFRVCEIVAGWKRFSARELNVLQRMSGAVWQKEYFDTCVRDERGFRKALSYVKSNNPELAWSAYEAERGEA